MQISKRISACTRSDILLARVHSDFLKGVNYLPCMAGVVAILGGLNGGGELGGGRGVERVVNMPHTSAHAEVT